MTDRKIMHMLLTILRRLAIGIGSLLVLVGFGRLGQVGMDSLYFGVREPYLQSLSSTAVTIRWQSEDDSLGVVRYGTAPDRLIDQVVEFEADDEHEVRLTGLSPDTRYYYSVGTKSESLWQGEDYHFTTFPPIGHAAPLRALVLGDPGYWNSGAQRVRDAAQAWVAANPRPGRPPLDLLLTTGDNAYTSGRNEEYQAAIFHPYRQLLRQVSFWPAYGNHDARRWAFFNIFTLPAGGEAGGVASGTENYFAIDFGNVHLLFLDSEESDLSPGGAMAKWLQKNLAATDQRWLVAVIHHPPYSKGSHDSDSEWDSHGRMGRVRRNLLPLLEQAGVDLVLSGHSHAYERSYLLDCHYGPSQSLRPSMVVESGPGPYRKRTAGLASHEGTIYAVVGSSSKVDRKARRHPAMAVAKGEMGALVLDVEGLRMNGRFINDKGEVSDYFTLIKGDLKAPRRLGGCAGGDDHS